MSRFTLLHSTQV